METSDTSIMHKIYSALLSQIIQGAIQPDQVLNEKKLMAQFDVSRAPFGRR